MATQYEEPWIWSWLRKYWWVIALLVLLLIGFRPALSQGSQPDSTIRKDSTEKICGRVWRTARFGDTAVVWIMKPDGFRALPALRLIDSAMARPDKTQVFEHTKKFVVTKTDTVKACTTSARVRTGFFLL